MPEGFTGANVEGETSGQKRTLGEAPLRVCFANTGANKE
jgi:hypothetical protein